MTSYLTITKWYKTLFYYKTNNKKAYQYNNKLTKI